MVVSYRRPANREEPASSSRKKKPGKKPNAQRKKTLNSVREALTKKVPARGSRNTLSKIQMARAATIIHDDNLVRHEEFAALYKSLEHLTDDELLARLQPWIKERRKADGSKITGRPPSQPMTVTDEKRVLAYRLHMRGVSADQIAESMALSREGAQKLVQEARANLRVDPEKIDVPAEIGQSLDLYADIKQMALSIAGSSKNTPNQRTAAMSVALQAENQRTGFLKLVGVFTPQLQNVLQSLVIGALRGQLGGGGEQDHDMGKAVNELGRMLMNAGLQDITGKVVEDSLQSIAKPNDFYEPDDVQLIAQELLPRV